MTVKVINLFGGPCSGKSTIAAELFAVMKRHGHNVELVTEFAKELTYEKRHNTLKDQLYIVARQNHRMVRLSGQVDYIIVDSPLLMNLAYVDDDYLPNNYRNLVIELFDTYNNLNFFIERGRTVYQSSGRNQTYDEAVVIDHKILSIFNESHSEDSMSFIPCDSNSATKIFEEVVK